MFLRTVCRAQGAKAFHQNANVRFLATQVEAAKGDKISQADKQIDYANATPYSSIPGPSVMSMLRAGLPGGSCYKMAFDEVVRFYRRKYGDILKFPGAFGNPESVITHNPDNFATVYRTEGPWPEAPAFHTLKYYREKIRPDIFGEHIGLLLAQGKKWADFRTVVNPIMMQPKATQLYIPTIEKVAGDFIERILKLRDPTTNQLPGNFEDEIHKWSLESIGVVALDTRLGLISDKYSERGAKFLHSLKSFFRLVFELEFKPSLWRIIATPKFKEMMKVLDTMTDLSCEYVDEAKAKLAERSKNDTNSHEESILEKLLKIDPIIAKVMAMDMLFAGVDTTSSAFVAALYLLSKNPEKQGILRKELLTVLPDKNSSFTVDKMARLPYLRACLKEGHRLYPVINGELRRTGKDLVLDGYQIPKGTLVVMNSCELLKDEHYFSDPTKFVPERWLKGEEMGAGCPASQRTIHPFLLLPFGFGPRACIGKRFADMEIEILIAKLVRNFYITWEYPDLKFKWKTLNAPDGKLTFTLTDEDIISGPETQIDYSKAAPYSSMPGPTIISLLRANLPGGSCYKKGLDEMLRFYRKKYGDLCKLPGVFGHPEVVVTHNPDHFEMVLRTEGIWPHIPTFYTMKYFREKVRPDVFGEYAGLLMTEGKKWAEFRSAVNPVMVQPRRAKLYIPTIDEVADNFLERIRKLRDSATNQLPGNFEAEIHKWALESIGVIALDKRLGLISDDCNEREAKFLASLESFFRLAYDLEFKPSLWRIIATPKFKEMMKVLTTMTDLSNEYIDEAKARLDKKANTAEKDHEESVLEKLFKINPTIAKVMAIDMLFAGVDTTSSAFKSALYILSKNPEKQEALRKEILTVLPRKDSSLTVEKMARLPYLRACLKESHRLHPVIHGNVRGAGRDLVLDGYQIPKGTFVVFNSPDLMKDEAYFPDATKFIPERWLKDEGKGASCPGTAKTFHPFVFLPFGFGPRSCIGRRFAEMEIEILISKLVRNFYISWDHPDLKFKWKTLNVPDGELKFTLTDVNY